MKTSASTVIISVFFFLYLILPDYFAIEFSETLPLLTASRVLVLLFAVIVVINNKGKLKKLIRDKGYFYFISIMLFVNICNCAYSFVPSVKTIISLLFEYLLLTYLICSYVNTVEKIETALVAMIYASILIGILGVFEPLTGTNVFYYLTTTKREMLQSQYIRYGVLRASGPFGHAVYFGNYAVCIIPFSLYLYDIKKKPVFFMAFIINIISVIISGSRASVVFLIFLLGYIWIKKKGKDTRKYTRNILILIPACLVLFAIFPDLINKTITVIVSSLGSLTRTTGERTDSFVGNANAMLSRLEQWSGILWTFKNGRAIFGFGNNAHMLGMIRYIVNGIWVTRRSFDVGFVSIFCQYGVLGSIGYFILYFTRIRICVLYKNKIKSSLLNIKQSERLLNLQTTFQIFYIGYLVHLLSSVGVEQLLVVVLSLQISTNRICDKLTPYTNTKNAITSNRKKQH